MDNNFVSNANATDLMNAINQKKDTKPDTITWAEWIQLTDQEREGTHYIITNVPAQFSINDAIFSMKNRTLVFTNKTCTINDDRITADTYVLTFYNDEAVAQAAGIDCTWTTGSITFTVVDNPVSDIILDILFINPALSPGGGSGEGGHTIVGPTGTEMAQEDKLQFTGDVTVTDDSTNGKTVVNITGGGHTIQNTAGTNLAQEDTLQFVGVNTVDDSTDGKTKVNIVRNMTKAQMDTLSSSEKEGFIHTTDEPDSPYSNISNAEVTFTEASTRANIASGEKISTLFGKIKKWFSDLPNMFVSKSGDTMKGNFTVDRQNGTTAAVGYTNFTIGNNIAEGTEKNSQGAIRIYSNTAYRAEIQADNLTNNRAFHLPNKGGTIALTSDVIPKYGNKTLLCTITPSNTSAEFTPTSQGFVVLCAGMSSTAQNIKGRMRDRNDPYFGTSFNVTINAYAAEPICFIPCRANSPIAIVISGHTTDVSVYLY